MLQEGVNPSSFWCCSLSPAVTLSEIPCLKFPSVTPRPNCTHTSLTCWASIFKNTWLINSNLIKSPYVISGPIIQNDSILWPYEQISKCFAPWLQYWFLTLHIVWWYLLNEKSIDFSLQHHHHWWESLFPSHSCSFGLRVWLWCWRKRKSVNLREEKNCIIISAWDINAMWLLCMPCTCRHCYTWKKN